MKTSLAFEVCVDSPDGCRAAQEGGAQRVELCSGLVEGGITPSLGLIRLARQAISIAMHVLIRPRGGDFLYSELEFEVMCQDILAAKAAGADGVVIGLLTRDGRVDMPRTGTLVELARPLSVTFHRAMDVSRDSSEALEDLITLGIDRVLTSGRSPTAQEGADCLAGLVRQAAGRIAVMAGGGIRPHTVASVVAATGVSEVHFTARTSIQSAMHYRNPDCAMGKPYIPDEYALKVTEASLVRQVIQSVSAPQPPSD